MTTKNELKLVVECPVKSQYVHVPKNEYLRMLSQVRELQNKLNNAKEDALASLPVDIKIAAQQTLAAVKYKLTFGGSFKTWLDGYGHILINLDKFQSEVKQDRPNIPEMRNAAMNLAASAICFMLLTDTLGEPQGHEDSDE